MVIRNHTNWLIIELKINLFAPNPKGGKLIFTTPFRDGANRESQFVASGIKTHILNFLLKKTEYSRNIFTNKKIRLTQIKPDSL